MVGIKRKSNLSTDMMKMTKKKKNMKIGGSKEWIPCPFSFLPIDVAIEIFSLVPLKSISFCKTVSRSWYDYFGNPEFVEIYHYRFKERFPCIVFPSQLKQSYLIDPDALSNLEMSAIVHKVSIKRYRNNVNIRKGLSFDVVGSVNGLMCFSLKKDDFSFVMPGIPLYEPDPFYILNPITGDYVLLPKSPKNHCLLLGSGFGFDAVANKYKVVRILHNQKKHVDDQIYGNLVEIYTLGSGVWREIPLVCNIPGATIMGMTKQSNVCVNGCLHWTPIVDIGSPRLSNMIMSFHMSTERFELFHMPTLSSGAGLLRSFDLIVLCQQLCLLDGGSLDEGDVWVMKCHGDSSSWVKESVFSDELLTCGWHGFHEVMELNNSELLLVIECQTLLYYDCLAKTSKQVLLQNADGQIIYPELHYPVYIKASLLSPSAIECAS